MVKTITLKFAGTCKACGASLPVGSQARWTGRGRVFGLSCHAEGSDDGGLRWVNGRSIQANGACEDAPACGCCDQFGFQQR